MTSSYQKLATTLANFDKLVRPSWLCLWQLLVSTFYWDFLYSLVLLSTHCCENLVPVKKDKITHFLGCLVCKQPRNGELGKVIFCQNLPCTVYLECHKIRKACSYWKSNFAGHTLFLFIIVIHLQWEILHHSKGKRAQSASQGKRKQNHRLSVGLSAKRPWILRQAKASQIRQPKGSSTISLYFPLTTWAFAACLSLKLNFQAQIKECLQHMYTQFSLEILTLKNSWAWS